MRITVAAASCVSVSEGALRERATIQSSHTLMCLLVHTCAKVRITNLDMQTVLGVKIREHKLVKRESFWHETQIQIFLARFASMHM